MRRRGTTTPRGLSARVAAGFVAAGLVAGLVAGGLAGCTGGKREPSWTPTPWTPEETVEPSPTPTPDPATIRPARPEAMAHWDSTGAEAAAVYFLELYAFVYATNDLAEWAALSHPDCEFCASVAQGVAEQVSGELHCVGGLSQIHTVTSVEVEPGRSWAVEVDLTQGPSRKLDADGVVVEDFPDATRYQMTVAVFRDGQAWLIRGVDHRTVD